MPMNPPYNSSFKTKIRYGTFLVWFLYKNAIFKAVLMASSTLSFLLYFRSFTGEKKLEYALALANGDELTILLFHLPLLVGVVSFSAFLMALKEEGD